ncbi:hypothetical protein [Photobacterium lutimaris]|uniref:Uncharacterized protein n=1 Tax=Photobacterium lutimaris TaxID=388278 RepID=A0A2T3IV80_9GAMM|nr:hypothetical protein [Photobacterium lutimaris]PSU32305.1 hypothetical protein C9I99_19195 [Photobacterium lutimaris]TDR73179.1 hypothetical protein DFP78_11295 [Photobacterium lutimaris]
MLSPISAAINKLLRIEPQQLKAEQFTPPQQGAKLGASTANTPSSTPQPLPQAQWQVVRMLANLSGMSLGQTHAYTAPTLQSPSFRLAGGEGELQLRLQFEGQPHTVRWQIGQAGAEPQLLNSTLPPALSLALLPTVDQGWRLVAKGVLHNEPLQLLWTPYGNNGKAGSASGSPLSLKVWLRTGFIITVIVFSLCYWLF